MIIGHFSWLDVENWQENFSKIFTLPPHIIFSPCIVSWQHSCLQLEPFMLLTIVYKREPTISHTFVESWNLLANLNSFICQVGLLQGYVVAPFVSHILHAITTLFSGSFGKLLHHRFCHPNIIFLILSIVLNVFHGRKLCFKGWKLQSHVLNNTF